MRFIDFVYLCSRKSANIPDFIQKSMEKRKRKKKIANAALAVTACAAAATAVYVFGHKPALVEHPCFRSCHLVNGCKKRAFTTAWRANWQSVKQFLFHGEVCNAYQVGNLFYTGHSKYAFCRNINPFK